MATVYLALVAGPRGFNKLMVVKVLRDDLMPGSDEAVKMFWGEARLSAQLVHSNIVHTYEVGEIDGHYIMAMEYLDGQTLRAIQIRTASAGGIPLHESLRILAEAARGLHYSHGLKSFKGEPLGVVHRDVSPQNLMITYDGQVKVLDFGIAKMRDSDHLTQAGMIKGKLEYVAPEQLKNDHLDGRADVFALGAMLWEALTGERFAGGNKVPDVAKVHTRLSGGERKVRELNPQAPEQLAQIVDRAIAVDPNVRYPSALAFAAAIDGYLATVEPKPSAETLAAFLQPTYAAERARMNALIEQQIERSETTGTGPIPNIGSDLPSVSASGVVVNDRRGDTVVSPAPGLATAADAALTVASKKTRGRAPLWIGISVAVVVAAGLALRPSPRDATPTAIPATVAPVLDAVAPPPEPAPAVAAAIPASPGAAVAMVLEVRVTPPTATVTLDGAPLTLPFKGRFQKSDNLHMIEAHADGYRPFKRLVPFTSDQELEIVLSEAQPAQQAGRRSSRPATTDRPRTEPTATATPAAKAEPAAAPAPAEVEPGVRMTPNSGASIRRKLIVSDPYAN